MNVYDVIQTIIERYRNGVRYQQLAYNVFAANYQYNFDTIVREVTSTLSREFQNCNYPKRSVEILTEYWLLKIVINTMNHIGRTLNPDETYAYSDIVHRYDEININVVNRNSIVTNHHQGIPRNQPTQNPIKRIFNTDGQQQLKVETNFAESNNLPNLDNNDGILALLMSKQKQEESKLEENKVEVSSQLTNSKSIEQEPNLNHSIMPIQVNSTSQMEQGEYSSDENKLDLPDGTFTEVIGLPDNSTNDDKIVDVVTDVESNTDVNDENECNDTITQQDNTNNKRYEWRVNQYKSMTEEETVNYAEHELNTEELNRYKNISNYSSSVIPIIEEQKKSDVTLPIIKTDDLHLTNKLIYLPQSSDIGGTDEYYNNIHADGKGVITLLAEYGHTSGVFIGDDATRRTLIDFNSKKFTISNLDVLIKLITASRGGRIMRNLLNCKLSEWVHDMIRIPFREQTIPLILDGNFKEDLNEYLKHIDLNQDIEDAHSLLMNHSSSLGNYMPIFKSLRSLYLDGHHLPVMDLLPVEEYDKCVVGINYTAMVRIPVDFKCLGLDVIECPNSHFIGKIDDYKQFFLLEKSVLDITKTMDSDVNNIRLIIADSSGHVVNFKRVEEPIAIIKIEKR